MKDKKKIIFNAVFLILCFSLTLFYVFKGEDFKAVLRFIRRAGGAVWLIGLLLVTAFILCESLIIYYLMKNLKQKPKLMHCCLYSFVGFFFSLVTPTASGGQPMQLVFMGRDKLPVHISSMILLLITIAYKTVLVMIGALLLLFRPRRLLHLLRPALFWVKLGMLLNVLCVSFMAALVFCPLFTKKLVLQLMERFSPLFPRERWNAMKGKAAAYMDEYREASAYIKKNRRITAYVFLITFAQRCLLFAVTYLVFVSFGVRGIGMAETITLQGTISLAADMLPLPGGMGISEHLFERIFTPVCGVKLITPIMVVSRGLSFYAQLLISAVFTAIAYLVIFGKENHKHDRIL